MFDLFVIKLIAGMALLGLAIRVAILEAENISRVYSHLRGNTHKKRTPAGGSPSNIVEGQKPDQVL